MATDDDGDVGGVGESGVAECTAVAIAKKKVWKVEGKGERSNGKGARREVPCDAGLYIHKGRGEK